MRFDKLLKRLGIGEKSRLEAATNFILRYWWLWCLIFIVLFSFWSRMLPAKYGELQALDPFYAYRMNLYMLENNLQLPLHDNMRYWPDGIGIKYYGPLLYFYLPVVLYLVFVFFGAGMTYLEFAIMYPALMGAVSVFFIFWLAREIFDDNKAGLFSALFLATVPGYLARTSAGFFDKEATGGTFMLIALFLFVRAYKTNSWKLSLLSAAFVFLAMGSWGGAQFIIYILSVFLLFKLVINQYSVKMVSAGILPLLSAILTQRFFLGVTGISFEQVVASITVCVILIRFAAEKYKLVKDEQLPYFVPGLFVVIILFVLLGSMFIDPLWNIVQRGIGLIYIQEKGFIGATVAEQQEGTWGDVTSRTTITYSRSILGLPQIFETLFSIWFLFIVGSLAILYSVYKERNWTLLLPLFWLVMSIQTVFFMVRLVFFLGPPSAVMAGYAMAFMLNKFSGLEYIKRKEGLKKINILSIPVIAVVSLVVLSNLATGFVFTNSVGPSYNSYWDQAMNYLKTETPVNSSILSWWDFGYWFQTKGERPSIADGGNNNGTVNQQIAQWYVADSTNWTDYRWWYKGKDVDYILMDYTLPGKYGAISKIASRGDTVIGMLQMQQSKTYPQQNKTIIEYKAGQYAVWLPVSSGGQIAGSPIFMITQGDQYVGRNYITDICTVNGIIRTEPPENGNVMPGCVTIAPYGLFYIPPEAEFSIFTNLMFMDGYGIPDVKKVFDNQLIKIYKLEINESIS
ncbi:MAG: glycosyltransferase family 39 protein [Candidatus Aenigmatarchaeota archaeon]|nr:MAG: glycosyltransferase family 39 protein [Candidatus Aenigmarchaeota archaeon]